MKRLFYLLFFLLFTFQNNIYSQNKSVSGIIKGENGQSLPGAFVINKKTKKETFADIDGKFEINVKQKDKIIISFFGYEPKEIKITNEYYFEITLEVAKRKISRSERRMIRREKRKNGYYIFPD